MRVTLTYHSNVQKDGKTCTICMDKQVDCSSTCHVQFCTTCLLQWLKSNNTCPLCRKTIDHVVTSNVSYKPLPPTSSNHGIFTEEKEVDMILRKLIRRYFPRRQHEVYAQMSSELSKYDAHALLRIYNSCAGIIERWCMDYTFKDLMMYFQCNQQIFQNMILSGWFGASE